jgi:HD-GYP domain-containing protein (c-di-GMP phosphodiesterase class II)/DNA-binding CsgD family transcriptional regulator
MAIGNRMGLDPQRLRSLFQSALLKFLGCTADASNTASAVGGNDLAFNAAMGPVFYGGGGEIARTMVSSVGHGKGLARRGRLLLAAMTDTKSVREGLAAHCEVATMLASRLGMDEGAIQALRHVYERWDGKGFPAGTKGTEIPIESRIIAVAGDVDLFITAGTDPDEIISRRNGKGYDPSVVAAWHSLEPQSGEADWEQVMTAEPQPFSYLSDLDTGLMAMADFADLKSPWTRGHSRRVATLASEAAERAGFPAPQVRDIGRAGMIHDLGRVGVESGIWDKHGPLSSFEWEKVMLHPYLTGRILNRCPALRHLEPLASSHHERIDGSGYHHQWAGDQLSPLARILAAADVFDAVSSDRPHRPGLGMDQALIALREEAESGRLDAEAVAHVAATAGGELEAPPPKNPHGLTDREIEVLAYIATGLTNRVVGEKLFISTKTVGRHVENIYNKIGVSTRAGAAIYAMEQGLLR